jgi:diguanylate cyclase (GGDEF)-like protein
VGEALGKVDVSAGTASATQSQVIAAVSQARERVRASLDRPEDLPGELVRAAAAVVEAPVTVALLDAGRLVRRAVSPAAPLPAGGTVITDGTICGEALAAGRPVRVDDILEIPDSGAHPGRASATGSAGACCPGARALLSVPIVTEGGVVGVLSAAADRPGWFDAMDERALSLVADVAAARLAASASMPGRAPSDRGLATELPAGDVVRSGLAALGGSGQAPGLGVWEWRPAVGELTWSAELFRILGFEPGRFRPTPQACRALVHPEDAELAGQLIATLRRAAEGAGDAGGVQTFRVIGADGALRSIQVWAAATADAAGLVVHGAVVDVTRQERDRVLLERLSATDPVTGLGNRLAFDRRMKEVLAAPGDPDVSLLLLDLDRFKLVNDSLGHQVGDRLLGEVARRLRSVVPEGSITARMGGDEFVVVPPAGFEWLHVRRLAQGVVDALRTPYVLPDSGEILVCPASVGVTSTAGRDVTADELLSEADLALYRAKDAGRDRYVVYDDALRLRARNRHNSELLLRSALEQGRLRLQYQPIVAFETGRIVGVEALVRVVDQGGERLLPPDNFIQVAEDTGLVVELDLWVIDAAVSQLARWLDAAPAAEMVPWVAVNVSPRSMEHPRVVRRLVDGLQERHIQPHQVKVELTEHSFLGTLPSGESTLRQLLTSGIPVGIDDFGTGYSAMAYLNRFDLDFMKIDRSFVGQVGSEQRADAVVTAIVDLAHAHGMQVTAEGVETQRQARRLREIGCDFAQGYHFGHPTDADRLLRG